MLITTNDDHLLGPEISRTKPSNTYRVLILGDSSPVGLGLASRRETFPELWRFLLGRYFAGRKEVEVINAAVSGYSSEQVARFLALRGWTYQPDVIVVYCGNNDASVSGSLSDRDLLSAQSFGSVRKFMSNFALYRVLCCLLNPRSTSATDSPLVVRVSPDEYEENLRAIAAQCDEHSCRLLIIKPPVPHLWPAGLQFKPFLHITGVDGDIIMPEAMRAMLHRELAYCVDRQGFQTNSGKQDLFTREVYASAYAIDTALTDMIAHYRALADSMPDDPVAINNLAVAWWYANEFDSAATALMSARMIFRRQNNLDNPVALSAYSPFLYNSGINYLSRAGDRMSPDSDTAHAFVYLDSALQADYFSLRIKQPYLDAIDNVEAASPVTIINLPEIFAQNGGERLFVDHCHPTAEGHRLIAETIFRTLFGEPGRPVR